VREKGEGVAWRRVDFRVVRKTWMRKPGPVAEGSDGIPGQS
jgi:hypothetical protein